MLATNFQIHIPVLPIKKSTTFFAGNKMGVRYDWLASEQNVFSCALLLYWLASKIQHKLEEFLVFNKPRNEAGNYQPESQHIC